MQNKWYRIAGYTVLIISILLWVLIAVIPFLGFSTKEMAGIITGLIIAGEITFYLGILLLGKTIYAKIKSKMMFWKKKTEDGSPKSEVGSWKTEDGSEKRRT
jgi:hypothetical protein